MKIICVGRNYSEHVKEMDSDFTEDPLIFLKPDSAILRKNFPFYLPAISNEVHFECELVIKINKIGKFIQPEFAHTYYNEIALGIDFTARDLQREFKKKGMPWDLSKGFDGSAFVSDFYPKSNYDLNNLNFEFHQNGNLEQQGNSKQMIFSIDQIITFVSQFYTLKIGDLIFTGTPSGVGKINPEDKLEGYLEKEKVFEVRVK